MHPVTFGGHRGALHPAARGPAHGLAVVLCPPVGRDGRCAYRPLWLFAERLAADGFPVLRYDHLGTGDSLGVEPDLDQWTRWIEGVAQAADFARAHAGADQVVLAGLRIGASLAACAAAAVRPRGLMLLAPVVSGRAWLRELQFSASILRVNGDPRPQDGSVEGDGLRLSPAAAASLQSYDLSRLGGLPDEVFLAAPPGSERLAARLGPAVTAAPFEGYDALFDDAHINRPPAEVFDAAAAWLGAVAAVTPGGAAAVPPPPAVLMAEDWVERPVEFDGGLRGMLTLPALRPATCGVIVTNTGADPRAGIAEFAVHAARALAGRGGATLRFDFSGLGESAARGTWRSHVYEDDRTAELQAAADLLGQYVHGPVVLAGVCSGAYHAIQAAIADPRFKAVVAINAANYAWERGARLETDYSELHPNRRVSLRSLIKVTAWRRLLAGDVDLMARLAGLARRLWRRLGLARPTPRTRALREGLARISRHGARLLLVVGREDRALDELEVHFARNGRWLRRRPGFEVSILPGLDHGLFFPESRAAALAEFVPFVESVATENRLQSHALAWPEPVSAAAE